MQGASPLASPGWTGRGTGSVSVGGAPWEACLFGRWFALLPRYPAGAYLLCRLPTLPLACFSAPIPLTPFPAGRGRFLVFLCKGLRPLHPRGLDGARHWLGERWRYPAGACLFGRWFALPLWYPAEGLPSWSPADAAFSFCFCPLPRGRISGGQIRQAHEKCRLIKIPRGGHTDATAQRGDNRLSCRQCLPRRNRNRVREQKKHRRNRGN